MTRYRTIVLVLGGLAAALLMLGWLLPEPDAVGADDGADPPPALACTEIGCETTFTARLGKLRLAYPKVRRVVVCVSDGGGCVTTGRRGLDRVGFTASDLEFPDPTVVTYRAKGKAGRLLGSGRLEVTPSKNQPNGEDCPPTCFTIAVSATRFGQLIDRSSRASIR